MNYFSYEQISMYLMAASVHFFFWSWSREVDLKGKPFSAKGFWLRLILALIPNLNIAFAYCMALVVLKHYYYDVETQTIEYMSDDLDKKKGDIIFTERVDFKITRVVAPGVYEVKPIYKDEYE